MVWRPIGSKDEYLSYQSKYERMSKLSEYYSLMANVYLVLNGQPCLTANLTHKELNVINQQISAMNKPKKTLKKMIGIRSFKRDFENLHNYDILAQVFISVKY